MTEILPALYVPLPYFEDSAIYFARIRDLACPVFLDSARIGGSDGRYDIMTAQPFMTFQTTDGCTRINLPGGNVQQSDQDPFQLLQQTLAQYACPQTVFPFSGGAIGHFSYDLGREIEKLPSIAADEEQLPQMAVGLYDWAIVVDHQNRQCCLCSHAQYPPTRQQWKQLQQRLSRDQVDTTKQPFRVHGPLSCNLDKQHYQQAFDKIQHYITEGDCYQVNLARRFEISAQGDPWFAYQQLRQHNAAPFSAFFELPCMCLLSSSPERLLKVTQNQVETKPIKGTRPRDLTDPQHDRQLAEILQNSIKDRAENLMIVDLLRNDLGKVCKPGSIKVPKPFALESFATVHHLVSTISAELAENETAVSLLKACFPGGSITGAPKCRAMEIIEELEPHRRGAYCGSLGYIGFDGNMDSNITIRTLVYNQQRLRFWAGGGIVKDSDMEAEYQEVQDKAAAMFKLVEDLRQ